MDGSIRPGLVKGPHDLRAAERIAMGALDSPASTGFDHARNDRIRRRLKMLSSEHQALPVIRDLEQKCGHIFVERLREHDVVFQDEDGRDVVLNRPLQQDHVRTQATVTAAAGLPKLWNAHLVPFDGAEYLR